VGADSYGRGAFGPYLGAGTSSFTDFLAGAAPELLPQAAGAAGAAGAAATLPPADGAAAGSFARSLTHGTTIVAAACDGGVVMAGDRRATAGNMIAQRHLDKVFRSDDFSAVGISGVAGTGIELARLFQVELEHYEKLEGHALSLDGKANRLASMVRGNIGAAMQGLVVVPLFCGYDEDAGFGRIFSYDVAGGRYEEHRFYAIGSGSVFARGSLKKLYSDGMSADDTALVCMQALYDAADDDSATGGPDVSRRIYPVVAIITADGYERLTDEQAGAYAQTVIEGRLTDPDGPPAPLHQAGTPNGGRNALPSG
jgi:proteasome beta subunit